uniref:Gambicin n=1 Tax=Anopheles funestus TaxID=62324 RepID=A0A182RK43_ANOFN
MKQVYILLAVLLCTATVADAIVNVYASTCAKCKAIGARYCDYGNLRQGIFCVGQTTINSCGDCQRYGGRCSSFSFLVQCNLF